MSPVTITLPWPSPILSPNGRAHWAKKAKAVKAARHTAWGAVLAVVGASPSLRSSIIGVSLTFHPPDRRRRDADNLLSSCKASLDGIADALGVDDSRFETSFRIGEPVKGGAVLVEILPLNK